MPRLMRFLAFTGVIGDLHILSLSIYMWNNQLGLPGPEARTFC